MSSLDSLTPKIQPYNQISCR